MPEEVEADHSSVRVWRHFWGPSLWYVSWGGSGRGWLLGRRDRSSTTDSPTV